jgi:hypothetical protein
LVWLDAANFAGIQGKLPDSLQNEVSGQENVEDDEEQDGVSVGNED